LWQVGRPAQALEQRAVVGRRQPASLDVLVELLLDPGPLRVERPRGGLRHDRVEAGAGRGLCDAEPHPTGAEDADAANLHRAENLLAGLATTLPAPASTNIRYRYPRRRAGWSCPPRQVHASHVSWGWAITYRIAGLVRACPALECAHGPGAARQSAVEPVGVPRTRGSPPVRNPTSRTDARG